MRIAFASLLFSLRLATCCDCVLPTVKAEVKRSEVVFRGTITEIRDSQIVFTVHRVFKGRVPANFAMANWVMDDECSFGFAGRLVKTGNELLVYAWRAEFFHEGLLTSVCSRTGFIHTASEDLKKLGRGHPPSRER